MNGAPPRRGRAAALLLAVFLAGAVAGAAGLALGQRSFRSEFRPEGRRGRSLDRLTRELRLDEVQRREIDAILERQRDRMRPLFAETQREIRSVLRPDQQTRFDAMPRPGRRR